MATSLLVLAGAGWASAQAPKWENNAPAQTQWAPFPTTAAPAAPKVVPPAAKPIAVPPPAAKPIAVLPPAALPPVFKPTVVLPPPPLPVITKPIAVPPQTVFPASAPVDSIGTRVVLFQKPAELPMEVKPIEPSAKIATPTKAEPSREEVFRMTGDDARHADILKLAAGDQVKSNVPLPSRAGTTPPMRALLEPGYVVHRRLFFEEKNAERYGWNLGMAQPFVSAAYFYKDLLLWPSHIASNLRERYDTNAGKFLPGSPVPYYLYPPEITLKGGALGAGAILAVIFLLP